MDSIDATVVMITPMPFRAMAMSASWMITSLPTFKGKVRRGGG
jgi:hypothetical protein